MNLAFRAAVLGQQHAAEVADRLARILLGRRRLGRMLAAVAGSQRQPEQDRVEQRTQGGGHSCLLEKTRIASASGTTTQPASRSEEHTSELQSLMRISYAVFCLKKKNQHTKPSHHKPQ